MHPQRRSCVAILLSAIIMATLVAGCSKPIDPQSSVPAVYQPLVFVAAAIGVGILITSNNHKNNNQNNGGSPTPAPAAPTFVGTFPALGRPIDISLDFSTAGSGGVGALGTMGSGFGYSEIGSPGANNGFYALPAAYRPIAVAIDGNGNDWFVNSSGLVDQCLAATSTPKTCTPAVTFVDGLGTAGTRTIAADSARVFIAQDNQAGTVSWAAFALDGTGKTTGSYTYSGTSMYTTDAAQSTIGAIGIYTIFHKNGASFKVAIPTSSQNPYNFSPAPLPGANMASDGLGNNYGTLGSPTSGSYLLGHYVSPGNSSGAPGTLLSQLLIASNGQTNNTVNPFFPPVTSLHTDDTYVFMLDSRGQLVLFTVF
ncbi:MAG: hypothetical protein JO009_05700 [Candidatus Eremiobacteraeota bacterium]|nr:hypothetical protein [Candidatus Eremiobacteraeota bacterium]